MLLLGLSLASTCAAQTEEFEPITNKPAIKTAKNTVLDTNKIDSQLVINLSSKTRSGISEKVIWSDSKWL